MKHGFIGELRCPGCEVSERVGRLRVSTHLQAIWGRTNQEDDLIYGIVECGECGREFPVLCGVAVLVEHVDSYVRNQFDVILSECGGRVPVPEHLLHYMREKGWDLAVRNNRDYYDGLRKLGTYINAQYDIVKPEVLDNSFARYLAEEYSDFYMVVLELLRKGIRAERLPVARCLEVGSYVGGVTGRLSKIARKAVGVDLSFSGVLTAREIQLCIPKAKRDYRLVRSGVQTTSRRVKTTCDGDCEYVVASGEGLPFARDWFDLVVCLNVLELVREPRQLVKKLARSVKEGGYLLLTSPYFWEDEDCRFEEWIGGREGEDSGQELRKLLGEEGVDVVEEAIRVPWILRYSERAFRCFLCDVIVGRKQGNA